MHRVRLALLVVSGISGSLLAQAPSTTQPAFRAGTTLVEVSAIVTIDGRPVTDLRADEVTVLDNGKPQPLVAFEYVDLGQGERPEQRRDFVIVVDDLHIHPRRTQPAMDVALRFVDALGPHDRLAVVFTAPPQGSLAFTTGRAEARNLIASLRGRFVPEALMSLNPGRGGPSDEANWRTRDALDVLAQVASAVRSDVAERRAVLFISEGHPTFQETPSAFGSRGAQATTAEFNEVLREAALANVAIYTVDPRGLRAQDTAAIPSRLFDASTTTGPSLAADATGSLAALALNTGGVQTRWTNDLTAGFDRLFADSRQYYRLAYLQPEPAPGKRQPLSRRIDVEVTRRDVDVRARRRYSPRAPDEGSQD